MLVGAVVAAGCFLAGSAQAAGPQAAAASTTSATGVGLRLLPALQGTVKDACTGVLVPNLSVSVLDGTNVSLAPTKLDVGTFSYPTLPGSDLVLQVSAPGYLPLNSNGFASNGYNTNGFNGNGFATSGVSVNGFAGNGVPNNGVPNNGVPNNGVPNNGVPSNGVPNNGIDTNGIPGNGTGTNGLNTNGFNSNGINSNGFNSNGFNSNGFNSNGFNNNGLNTNGFDGGGPRWNIGTRVVVMLTPVTDCPVHRPARLSPALNATVRDRATGNPVPGLSVALMPDQVVGTPGPGAPSGPAVTVPAGGGAFTVPSMPCGAYGLSLQAPGYQSINPTALFVDQHATQVGCDGVLTTGDIAYGTTMDIVLPAVGFNEPPKITWLGSSANATHIGQPLGFMAGASDPDGDPLTVLWAASQAGCVFADPTGPATTMTCTRPGPVTVTLTVTDPAGATDAVSLNVTVLPA